MVLPQLQGQVDQAVVAALELEARAHAAALGDHGQVLLVGQRLEAERLHLADQPADLAHPLLVQRRPVLEVEAGPLQEVGDPGLDLGRVGDPDRGQVGVAVEHPEVDPEGRRDQVVAGVVLRQRGQGELVEGGVPGAHDRRPVDPVLEPEHRVLVLAPVGRERQRVGVQLLPPLGPRRGLDLEGAREPVRHGRVLSVEARVRARADPKLHVRAAATRGWPRCWPSGRRRWRPAWPPCGSRPSPAGPGAGSRPARRAGRRPSAHSTSWGRR